MYGEKYNEQKHDRKDSEKKIYKCRRQKVGDPNWILKTS